MAPKLLCDIRKKCWLAYQANRHSAFLANRKPLPYTEIYFDSRNKLYVRHYGTVVNLDKARASNKLEQIKSYG